MSQYDLIACDIVSETIPVCVSSFTSQTFNSDLETFMHGNLTRNYHLLHSAYVSSVIIVGKEIVAINCEFLS